LSLRGAKATKQSHEIASPNEKNEARNDQEKGEKTRLAMTLFVRHCEGQRPEAISQLRLLRRRYYDLAGTKKRGEKDELAGTGWEGHRKRSSLDLGWRLPWRRTRLFTVARGTKPEPAMPGKAVAFLSRGDWSYSGSCVGAIDVTVVEGTGPLPPPPPGNP
jgi:hypothetical protein